MVDTTIPQGEPRAQEFYAYAVSFTALVSGTDATGTINIEADSWFKAQKLTYFANIANAAQTESTRVIPLCSVVIIDTGSGRQLMNEAVSIPALFGNGQLPFILPTPKIFKPRAAIQVKVANFDAAVTYNLQVVLSGSKLWY